MKYRMDFVTNSSSSSFIINKKENLNSIEEVFQFLKLLCYEFLQKRQELIDYCKQDNRFIVKEENGKTSISFANKTSREEWKIAKDFIEEQFGMHWFDVPYYKLDWLDCETYEEFLKKTEGDYYYINIIDMQNPQFKQEGDIDSVDELIEWYMPCFNHMKRMDCEGCRNREYCYVTECDEEIKEGMRKTDDKKEILSTFFGRYCICSESGYIPDYVVRKLGGASTFWCNHMG